MPQGLIRYLGLDRITAVDVIVSEDDESGVGAHHQQAADADDVDPQGPEHFI